MWCEVAFTGRLVPWLRGVGWGAEKVPVGRQIAGRRLLIKSRTPPRSQHHGPLQFFQNPCLLLRSALESLLVTADFPYWAELHRWRQKTTVDDEHVMATKSRSAIRRLFG